MVYWFVQDSSRAIASCVRNDSWRNMDIACMRMLLWYRSRGFLNNYVEVRQSRDSQSGYWRYMLFAIQPSVDRSVDPLRKTITYFLTRTCFE